MLVIAAAFAAVASLQLVYMNYSRRRSTDPEFTDKQEYDNCVLRKQDMDIMEQEAVEIQLLSSESISAQSLQSDIQLEGTHEDMGFKKVHAPGIKDNKQSELQLVVSLMEEVLSNEERPNHEIYTFAHTDNALMKTTRAEGLISPSIETVGPIDLTVKMPEFMSEQEKTVVSDSSLLFSSCSSIPLERKNSDINHHKYYSETNENDCSEIMVSSCKGQLRELAKEVSDDCHEEKQSEMIPSSCLKSFSMEPPELSIQDNNVQHYRLTPSMQGSDVLTNHSLLTTDDPKGKTLLGHLKESSMSKEIEFAKSLRFTTDIGRGILNINESRKLSSFPKQHGFVRDGKLNVFVRDESDSIGHLRTYGRLLKDARLMDCLNLLDIMERKGLLNMDKVHHTSFLKACKRQKAVKEAFRFCKLIKKPTLSTFNMLLSVCASSQDFDGAFQVMLLVKEAGLKPDCKLYTTLISTCAKSGKVDAMFEVFHEMVNAGVEPNVNTYGALIDGCARAGQVAKAFGAYGIMRSKKVQPDRVIFNALITACGQSGAVDRAFDVLAEMTTEPKPLDPDHVTVGALMKTCSKAGQVGRVKEVYKMLSKYKIQGTPEVYTIAVNSCSQTGDLEFALSIYDDMKMNGVVPDEMFLSTIVDVAGHAGKVDTAFDILQDARTKGIQVGNVSYSSLMGACSNAKNWKKALELYEDIKSIRLLPTVSTLNALINSLCDGGQLQKSVEVLEEIKAAGVHPNIVTYSILIVACEKKDEAELGFEILAKAKKDGILPNLIMCRCLTGLCLKSFGKAYSLGDPVVTFISGKPQIDSEWTSRAIMVYRETISAGIIPSIEVFSQVLGCLQFPRDSTLRDRFIGNLGINFDTLRLSNISSLLDGFGEYDTRCFSVLEEAVSLGVIPRASFKENPIVIDARKLLIHTVEVYVLTILKGLKHRLAAGARLPNIIILLPVEKKVIKSGNNERTINFAGRVGQAVGSLLRRMGLPYSGDESYGKIRIMGLALRRWLKPKIAHSSVDGKPVELIPTPARLAKGISDQQRSIRTSNNLSMD